MDIAAVRTELADAASSVAGLNCYGHMPGTPTMPAFVVGGYRIDYDRAMNRGLGEIVFTCWVLTSRADDLAGQELMDDYLAGSGPSSLKVALEAARGAPGEAALGGEADDLHVQSADMQGFVTVSGTEYVGAQITIRVIGTGG